MALGWPCRRAWFPDDAVDAAAFCVAGVALGDIHLHFAWQARHLATSTVTLRGRRGTWWHPPSLCVAGVALGDMDLHFAWHFCVAGVALGDIHLHFAWQAWHLWHWAGPVGALGSQMTPWTPWLFANPCLSSTLFNYLALLTSSAFQNWQLSVCDSRVCYQSVIPKLTVFMIMSPFLDRKDSPLFCFALPGTDFIAQMLPLLNIMFGSSGHSLAYPPWTVPLTCLSLLLCLVFLQSIFFAFLLVSFDLSRGQVPFRLHHTFNPSPPPLSFLPSP